MTITLNLPPQDEAQLNEIAAQEGQNADMIAYSLFSAALARKAREREKVVEAIREGLEDSLAGRVTSLAEWDAKFRAKYNIPADVEAMSDEEARTLS